MRLLRMIAISNRSWAVLKVACALVFFLNVYILLQLFSKESPLNLEECFGKLFVVRPPFVHPFAHLLPAKDLPIQKKCIQPKLSLQHDTLTFGYERMEPLNCSGSNFFYLHNGYLIPNPTFQDRKQKTCKIFAVKRESDSFSLLEKLMEIPSNVSVKVAEDFIYVRCFSKVDHDSKFDIQTQYENNIPNRPGIEEHIRSRRELKSPLIESESVGMNVSKERKLSLKVSESANNNKSREVISGFKEMGIEIPRNSRFSLKKNGSVSTDILTESGSDDVPYQSELLRKSKNGTYSVVHHIKRDMGPKFSINEQSNSYGSHSTSKEHIIIQNSSNIQKTSSIPVLRYIKQNSDIISNMNNSHLLLFNQDAHSKNNHPSSESQRTGLKFNLVDPKEKSKQPVLHINDNIRKIAQEQKAEKHKEIDVQTEADNAKEEYEHFIDRSSREVEQQDLDNEYNTRFPDEFYDRWKYMDSDEYPWMNDMYLDMPNCGEEQFLVQVNQQKHVFDRYRTLLSQKTSGMNVVMFGIDSMSNMAFQRKLPLSLNFLKKELNAAIFEGYNIVGDATTQALLPMFLGKLQQEIPDILERHLDGLDFVWKHYQMQGYVTLFAEDEPNLGVFNLRLRGFEELPTDHYMRYFWQGREESHLKQECSAKFCTGSTPNHQYLLQYLTDFFRKYSGIPHFAVGFSGELSHDDINPSEYLDKDLQTFLEVFKAEGYLNNTMLVVFADHGSRKGKFRRTLQGKMEERLPFLSIVLPTSFKILHKELYKNLRKNTKRLTSPFDVHETLLDILELSQVSTLNRSSTNRGISLFRPIPENRTCPQAGIDTHWCTCVYEKPVPVSDPVVKEVAEAVVSTINNLTQRDRSQCALLKLKRVYAASIVVPNIEVLNFHQTLETSNFTVSYGNTTLDMIEFQITVETNKCNGVFEVTVQARFHQNETIDSAGTMNNGKITYHILEHDISRINTYGSQPACISYNNPRIMKFCCCNDFLLGKKHRNV